MVWTNPATWSAGAVLTAAQLNQQVRDNLKAIGDAGTAYTPTWAGTGSNPAIGNGSITGGYNLAGKRLWFWMQVTMGTTTTYGSGTLTLSLPAGVTLAAGFWNFNGIARDTSAGAIYPMFAQPVGGTTVAIRTLPTTAGNPLAAVSGTVPFTWATGDSLFIHGEAETL